MIVMSFAERPQALAAATIVLISAVMLAMAIRWQPFGPLEIIAISSVFAGGIVSGLAGFAFSAIAGALMLHWVPPANAVSLLLACSITTPLMSIASLRHSLDWRRRASLLIGGA